MQSPAKMRRIAKEGCLYVSKKRDERATSDCQAYEVLTPFGEFGEMKHAFWISVAAGLFLVACDGTTAKAGYCGAANYSCCPTTCCAPSGDYCAAKSNCCTCYKQVREVKWEKEQYTCCKTVYDTVCEKVPVQCTRNVYETRYRDCCYTVCKPVYKTCYRDVCCTVRRPV